MERFVSPYELENSMKPSGEGAGDARPSGAQEFQDNSLFNLKCSLTCCACQRAWNPGSVHAGQSKSEGCSPASET